MPIRGYFEQRPFLWVTSVTIAGGLGGNGISVEGPVLEGRMSVDEAMLLDWIRGRRVERNIPGEARSSPAWVQVEGGRVTPS